MKKSHEESHKKTHRVRASTVVAIVVSSVMVLGVLFIIIAGFVGNAIAQAEASERTRAREAELMADPITPTRVYSAVNKLRDSNGAKALGLSGNMKTAAQQACRAMVKGKFINYKNPKTKKEINSYVLDNKGDLYIGKYIAILLTSTGNQTATELVGVDSQDDPYLSDPDYSIVGWQVCSPKVAGVKKVAVGMFAQEKEKPVTPVYQAPVYRSYSPRYCSTQYYSYSNSSSTTCY